MRRPLREDEIKYTFKTMKGDLDSPYSNDSPEFKHLIGLTQDIVEDAIKQSSVVLNRYKLMRPALYDDRQVKIISSLILNNLSVDEEVTNELNRAFESSAQRLVDFNRYFRDIVDMGGLKTEGM